MLSSISFSYSGRYLATGSHDKKCLIYDFFKIKKKVPKRILKYSDHKDMVMSTCFSENEEYFASGGFDKIVILYGMNPNNRETFGRIISKFDAQTHSITSVKFSRNNEYLATGNYGGNAIVYGINPKRQMYYQKPILKFKDHKWGISSVAFSPCSKYFLTGSWDKTALLYNINQLDQKDFGKSFELKENTDIIWSVCFSNTGNRIATCSENGRVMVYEFDDSKEFKSKAQYLYFIHDNNNNNVNNANAVLLNQLLGLETNITKIFSIAFSPLDDYIGTGNFNKRSRIYKVINKGEENFLVMNQFSDHTKLILSVCFSNSGLYATAGQDGTVLIYG